MSIAPAHGLSDGYRYEQTARDSDLAAGAIEGNFSGHHIRLNDNCKSPAYGLITFRTIGSKEDFMEKMQKVKTAVVGCGMISTIYIKNLVNMFSIIDFWVCVI